MPAKKRTTTTRRSTRKTSTKRQPAKKPMYVVTGKFNLKSGKVTMAEKERLIKKVRAKGGTATVKKV